MIVLIVLVWLFSWQLIDQPVVLLILCFCCVLVVIRMCSRLWWAQQNVAGRQVLREGRTCSLLHTTTTTHTHTEIKLGKQPFNQLANQGVLWIWCDVIWCEVTSCAVWNWFYFIFFPFIITVIIILQWCDVMWYNVMWINPSTTFYLLNWSFAGAIMFVLC